VTFQRYLASYRSQGLKRLQARHPALGKYPRSVVSTWAANFDAVQQESPAADVLRLSASLAPDAIPFELLILGAHELGDSLAEALAGAATDPLLIPDLLGPLAQFSPVRIDGESESYTIHRLVQAVLKGAMDEPARRQWSERALRVVSGAFPDLEHGTWPQCERHLPHALAVIAGMERSEKQLAEAGRLLNQTAIYLHARGQYAEAEPPFRQALEIVRTALGERHPDYATSLNNLATLYDAMGRHAEAEPLLKQALAIRRGAMGEGQPEYADSLNNLAALYYSIGRPTWRRCTTGWAVMLRPSRSSGRPSVSFASSWGRAIRLIEPC
jgi:hypothetical protein